MDLVKDCQMVPGMKVTPQASLAPFLIILKNTLTSNLNLNLKWNITRSQCEIFSVE
jgi:hypothetical protein